MMKSRKILIAVTIILTFLLLFVLSTFASSLTGNKEYAANEIEFQLRYMETVIGEQREAGWTDPEYAAKQLEQSLQTIQRSAALINESLLIGGKREKDILAAALDQLEGYQKNYSSEKGTDQNISNYEALYSALRKNGFGQGIQMTVNDFDEFIVNMESLYNSLLNPLESKNSNRR